MPQGRTISRKCCLWTDRLCRPHPILAHSDGGPGLGSSVSSSCFALLGPQRELEGILFFGRRAHLPLTWPREEPPSPQAHALLLPQAIIYEGQDKNPEMCRVLLTHEIMCR